jgi:hypothetical protein
MKTVSNIPNGLTSDILKSVFEPFGAISECSLVPGSTSGFIEYKELQSAKYAVDQMDGFELISQRLSVQWAGGAPPPENMAMPPKAPAGPAPPSASSTSTSTSSSSWRCTLLSNMVSVEETEDDELESEIIEECSKHGKVEKVKIVVVGDDAVRIFVLYEDNASASRAAQSLNGRFFGGRIISGGLYDHDVFMAGNYSA